MLLVTDIQKSRFFVSVVQHPTTAPQTAVRGLQQPMLRPCRQAPMMPWRSWRAAAHSLVLALLSQKWLRGR